MRKNMIDFFIFVEIEKYSKEFLIKYSKEPHFSLQIRMLPALAYIFESNVIIAYKESIKFFTTFD